MGPENFLSCSGTAVLGRTTSISTTKPIQEFGFVWLEVRLHQCLLQKLPCERDQTQGRGSGFPPMGALCLNPVHALE